MGNASVTALVNHSEASKAVDGITLTPVSGQTYGIEECGTPITTGCAANANRGRESWRSRHGSDSSGWFVCETVSCPDLCWYGWLTCRHCRRKRLAIAGACKDRIEPI